jgi:hypothetical protein
LAATCRGPSRQALLQNADRHLAGIRARGVFSALLPFPAATLARCRLTLGQTFQMSIVGRSSGWKSCWSRPGSRQGSSRHALRSFVSGRRRRTLLAIAMRPWRWPIATSRQQQPASLRPSSSMAPALSAVGWRSCCRPELRLDAGPIRSGSASPSPEVPVAPRLGEYWSLRCGGLDLINLKTPE